MRALLLSFCICCLAFINQAYALPTNQTFLSERVFIAPINAFITNDDVIQIVGHVLPTANTSLQPYSRYIYIELFDKQNSLIQREKIRCSNDGSFYMAMPLNKNIKAGEFYIRGYTQFMRNRKNSFYPAVPVYVNNFSKHNKQDTTLNIMCFPEGGHLVDGKLQNVCIYICNSCKYPQAKEYYIIKNDKDTIGHGSTDESGLAVFSYIPEHKVQYKLSLKDSNKECPLPTTMPIPTIKVSINKKRLICDILNSDGTTADDSLRLFAYHNSFGFKELQHSASHAIADLSECGTGLMTIWLTDSKKRELAQRTIWVGSNFGIADVRDDEIKINTNYKKGDTLSITIPENLYGSKTFVRFAPIEYKRNVSAYSMLNFANELFSPASFPTETVYTKTSAQKQRADIATWLLSATQTMLGSEILSRASISYPYPAEKKLYISGNVYDGKEPMPNSSIHIFNTSTKFATVTTTDTYGHFISEVADYNNGNKFFIQAYNKDGQAGQYSYSIDEYEFPTIINMNAMDFDNNLHTFTSGDTPYASTKDGINILDEVVVTSKKINKKPYNWAKARGADFFSRDMLQNHPGWQTIADAIIFTNKVGVTNDRNNAYWKSGRYNRMMTSTTSSDGTSQIGFAVNGFYINRDIADILNIQLSDVESIELVYPTDGRSLWYGASNGFYDVKLRSLMPAKNIKSNGVTVQPQGLSVPTIPYECRLPEKPGQYRLLIDIITPDKQIFFTTKTIVVHE